MHMPQAVAGVIDYTQVMSCLRSYKAPHRKMTELLKKGELIRVKKGLYVVGDSALQQSIPRELLANLIFGPSYISKEYALAFYGLIPERVEVVTSMTLKRNKKFHTSIGMFQYDYVNNARFSVGVDWLAIRENIFILMASPEKSLVDYIAKYSEIDSLLQMKALLFDNLRIEQKKIYEMDVARLKKINQAYKSQVVTLLIALIKGKK